MLRNVYNVHMPQAMCDVASGIGIGIGAAAADSIGYRAPARYRSNSRKITISQQRFDRSPQPFA